MPAEVLLQKFLRYAHLRSGDTAVGVTLNTPEWAGQQLFTPAGLCLAFLQTLPNRPSERSSSHTTSQPKLNAREYPERTGKLQKTELHKSQHAHGFATEPILIGRVAVPQGHEPIYVQGAVLSSLSSCPFNMDSPLPRSSNSCVITQGTSSKGWSSWATTAFFARVVCGWLRCPIWCTAESYGCNADPIKGVQMGGGARTRLSSPNRDWFTLTRISIHRPTLNSRYCATRHPWWPLWNLNRHRMCTRFSEIKHFF